MCPAAGCTLNCTLASGISRDYGGRAGKLSPSISVFHGQLGSRRLLGGLGRLLSQTGGCRFDSCRACLGRDGRRRGASHARPYQCSALAALGQSRAVPAGPVRGTSLGAIYVASRLLDHRKRAELGTVLRYHGARLSAPAHFCSHLGTPPCRATPPH